MRKQQSVSLRNKKIAAAGGDFLDEGVGYSRYFFVPTP